MRANIPALVIGPILFVACHSSSGGGTGGASSSGTMTSTASASSSSGTGGAATAASSSTGASASSSGGTGGATTTASSSTGASTSSSSGAPTPCTNPFQGSFTIHNALDVPTISPYCEITGDLTIDAAGLTSVSLPALQKIDGNLTAGNTNNTLATLDLPALTFATSVKITAPNLATLHLAELGAVPSSLWIGSGQLTTLALPKVTSAGASSQGQDGLRVLGSQLTSVDLSALATVSFTMLLQFGPTAVVTLPKLTTAGPTVVGSGLGQPGSGSVSLPLLAQTPSLGLGNLTSFSAPSLKTIDQGLGMDNVGSIDLSGLQSVGGVIVFNSAIDYAFPALTTAGGLNFLLGTSLSAPKLATVTGNLTITGATLNGLSLPALTTIGQSSLSGSSTIMLALGGTCDASSTFTRLDLPLLVNLGPKNTGDFNSGGNPNLPASCVQAVVKQLQLHGWTGQTYPTPPIPPNCALAAGPCP